MSDFDFGKAYEESKEALDGDILPNGEYDLVVRSVKSIITQGGKQAFRLVLEVTSGPYQGRTVPDQLTWSPENDAAKRIFAQSMNTLGATTEWITNTHPTPQAIADKITGAQVRAILSEDEWQGTKRNRIRFQRRNFPAAGGNVSGAPAGAAVLGGFHSERGPDKAERLPADLNGDNPNPADDDEDDVVALSGDWPS